MDAYEGSARLFRVLMHPARLEILDLLRDGEHCVCHLEAALGYRQAYISQQLSVLREAGLIQDRRDGWNIYYHVARPHVFAVLDAVQSLSGDQGQKSRQAARAVDCPCPQCSPVGTMAA